MIIGYNGYFRRVSHEIYHFLSLLFQFISFYTPLYFTPPPPPPPLNPASVLQAPFTPLMVEHGESFVGRLWGSRG